MPAKPFVGHFDQSDMAPPGSISMPGYDGANVQNVQIRIMVDELLGARQHAHVYRAVFARRHAHRQDGQETLPPVRGDLLHPVR
jgi:hypothetical protein